VLAIEPKFFHPDFENRAKAQLDRLAGDYGVHIPGRARAEAAARARIHGLSVPKTLVDRISAFAEG
jgi:(2R)-3-sulfolactate dehydrogenase (NADP+)